MANNDDGIPFYHFDATRPMSRKEGRSVTGAAAYRTATKIVDKRTGIVFDYRRKGGVAASRLVFPGGGTAKTADFWNRLELHQKRKDAVPGREVVLALPSSQLPMQERFRLAFDYGREIAERYGIATETSIHEPRRISDRDLERNPNQYWEMGEIKPGSGIIERHNGNWHLHMMLSTSSVSETGELGRKVNELDPNCCKFAKVENFVARERGRWAELTNERLAEAGSTLRVDHRSLAAQGRLEMPTGHLGPAAAAIERKTGKQSRRGVDRDKTFNSASSGVPRTTLVERKIERRPRRRRLRSDLDQVARITAVTEAALAEGKAQLARSEAEVEQLQKEETAQAAQAARDEYMQWRHNVTARRTHVPATPVQPAPGPAQRPPPVSPLRPLSQLQPRPQPRQEFGEQWNRWLFELRLRRVRIARPPAWRAGLGCGVLQVDAIAERPQFFSLVDASGVVVASVAHSVSHIEVVDASDGLAASIVLSHALAQGWSTIKVWGSATFKEDVVRQAVAHGVVIEIMDVEAHDALLYRREAPWEDPPDDFLDAPPGPHPDAPRG
jgi:MobA/MobL family